MPADGPTAGGPLAGFEADLAFETTPEATTTLHLPGARLPREPKALRLAAYLGIYDLLAELAVRDAAGAGGDAAAAASLEGPLRTVEATEGPLRFALFERGTKAEAQELLARTRGREIAVTEAWMVPKLEREIDLYRARVAALREALARAGKEAR